MKEKNKDLKACDRFVSDMVLVDDAISLSVVDICFHVSSIIFTFRFSSLFFFFCLLQIQSIASPFLYSNALYTLYSFLFPFSLPRTSTPNLLPYLTLSNFISLKLTFLFFPNPHFASKRVNFSLLLFFITKIHFFLMFNLKN